jgi:hypothetical protein
MAETQILQSRSQYSPPSRNYPQELPDYWRFEDGTLRTDLPELSDEELHALGWHGPIEMPPIAGTSYFTHNYEWNSETLSFDATEVDEYEKERRVNYNQFWNRVLESSVYQTLRAAASQSLAVNVYCTEFIALLSDAKMNRPNKVKLQESITNIFTNIDFTEEEVEEVQRIFSETGMIAVYTLF